MTWTREKGVDTAVVMSRVASIVGASRNVVDAAYLEAVCDCAERFHCRKRICDTEKLP